MSTSAGSRSSRRCSFFTIHDSNVQRDSIKSFLPRDLPPSAIECSCSIHLDSPQVETQSVAYCKYRLQLSWPNLETRFLSRLDPVGPSRSAYILRRCLSSSKAPCHFSTLNKNPRSHESVIQLRFAFYVSSMAHVILTGCTGTAGASMLAQCIKSSKVSRVSILSRRPVKQAEGQDKVKVHIQKDFNSYPDSLLRELEGTVGCIWALGISVSQVKPE